MTAASQAKTATVPAPVVPGTTAQLGAADAGKTITLAVGQTVSVALVGVPTAGYQWQAARVPSVLAEVPDKATGGPTVVEQSQPGFVGGNHWEVLVFAAKAAGKGTLVLEQRGPGARANVAETYKVSIVVK